MIVYRAFGVDGLFCIAAELLTPKEWKVHEIAACGVLREEERRGPAPVVRWLRPDYQIPRFGDKAESDLALDVAATEPNDDTPADLPDWEITEGVRASTR